MMDGSTSQLCSKENQQSRSTLEVFLIPSVIGLERLRLENPYRGGSRSTLDYGWQIQMSMQLLVLRSRRVFFLLTPSRSSSVPVCGVPLTRKIPGWLVTPLPLIITFAWAIR